MGYHVIIEPEQFPVKYAYVDRTDELPMLEGINARSVIIEGKAENPPQQVGMSAHFCHLGEEWYRAGLRARAIFAKLARVRRLDLEELGQAPENAGFYGKALNKAVKRGDFLVRSRGNIEVKVVCACFHGRGNRKYVLFSRDDLVKYRNLEEASRTPVLLAIFERKGDRPVEDSLCMIKVERIKELEPELTGEENADGRVYRIPLRETVRGFDLLGNYGMDDREDIVDLVERNREEWPAGRDTPGVIVAYYKDGEHLEWIVRHGLYNLRAEDGRGTFTIGREEACAKYILLHGKGELCTGKLFQILETGPQVYTREMLIRSRYPGMPRHGLYWVYRIVPVLERELQQQTWDISRFPGYVTGHGAACPFTVPLSELKR